MSELADLLAKTNHLNVRSLAMNEQGRLSHRQFFWITIRLVGLLISSVFCGGFFLIPANIALTFILALPRALSEYSSFGDFVLYLLLTSMVSFISLNIAAAIIVLIVGIIRTTLDLVERKVIREEGFIHKKCVSIKGTRNTLNAFRAYADMLSGRANAKFFPAFEGLVHYYTTERVKFMVSTKACDALQEEIKYRYYYTSHNKLLVMITPVEDQ